jgi:hypothetical protein
LRGIFRLPGNGYTSASPCSKRQKEYPERKTARQKTITRTEDQILESWRTNRKGAPHREKKIEESPGIHIRPDRVYQVLLFHGLVRD